MGTSVTLPPKTLHREHFTSLGTVGSCSCSVWPQPELCLPTQSPRCQLRTPCPPTEQGRRDLQGRGGSVEEQWQTWNQGVAKGVLRLPKLCCTAQSHHRSAPMSLLPEQ